METRFGADRHWGRRKPKGFVALFPHVLTYSTCRLICPTHAQRGGALEDVHRFSDWLCFRRSETSAVSVCIFQCYLCTGKSKRFKYFLCTGECVNTKNTKSTKDLQEIPKIQKIVGSVFLVFLYLEGGPTIPLQDWYLRGATVFLVSLLELLS